MRVDSSLNAMISNENKIGQMASNIANISGASNTQQEPQTQNVTDDLINSIIGQIPEVISYEANANSIKTQNAVTDSLLNIRA